MNKSETAKLKIRDLLKITLSYRLAGFRGASEDRIRIKEFLVLFREHIVSRAVFVVAWLRYFVNTLR